MNKALEQKLIGPLEESHTEEQSPKQFCEWSFEQGDRNSQQNEIELVLELDGDFFGRKMECVGEGISGGGTMGPRGRGRALDPRGQVLAPPPVVFSVPKILKYSIKNHTKFAGHLEHFYFRDIFIAWIILKTDR